MNKCECGLEFYDCDFINYDIEDGFLIAKSVCTCKCGKKYNIEELFSVDWKKPYDTLIEEV